MAAANSSSDDEPDYMSEDFLKQCTSNDVRPSLLHSRADKRKHAVMKRQHEVNLSIEEREKKKRKDFEDSLNEPIKEDNIGFKMLQRMGYKPGTSIGKKDAPTEGIKEPISIDLKKGRGGLGKERHEMDKIQQKLSLGNPEDYRLRRQAAIKAKEVAADLRTAQFACRSLDEENDKQKPLELWYWPVEIKTAAKPSIDDEEDSLEDAEGTKRKSYESEEEIEEEEPEDEIPNEVKLGAVVEYLRKEYCYCIWCGMKYDSNSDMENCPGTSREEH